MSEANKKQVGGGHYKTGIEHWDMVTAFDLDYFQAQATKYLTRHRTKNGKQDLEKCGHFLEKLLEILKGGARVEVYYDFRGDAVKPEITLDQYIEANNMDSIQRCIMKYIMFADITFDENFPYCGIQSAINMLEGYTRQQYPEGSTQCTGL
jgi:hypothetical protein